MQRQIISLLVLILIALIASSTVSAQRNVQLALDPIMEADAKHNLDVAKQAFAPAKRAYKQVLLRFEETFAAYPDFSGMEEFLYMAAMSSYYLSRNEGKQKVNLRNKREKEKYAPAKLREEAVIYFSLLLEKYPDTSRREEAEKMLEELKSAT